MDTEEANFLKAIAAEPDNEAPRLIFADWLEERGDPRAHWVRDRQVFEWMRPKADDLIGALLKILRGGGFEERKREMAREAILAAGPQAAHRLLPHLAADEQFGIERYGTAFLREMGAKAAPLLPGWVEVIESQETKWRTYAYFAIGFLQEAAIPALPLLQQGLKSEGYEECLAACEALGRIGYFAESTRQDLLRFSRSLHSQEAEERWGDALLGRLDLAVARTLANIGIVGLPDVDFEEAVSVMLLGLTQAQAKESDLELAQNSLRSIGPKALPEMLELMHEMFDGQEDAMVEVIADFGVEVVPQLMEAATAEGRYTFDVACRASRNALRLLEERGELGDYAKAVRELLEKYPPRDADY